MRPSILTLFLLGTIIILSIIGFFALMVQGYWYIVPLPAICAIVAAVSFAEELAS